MIAGWDFGGAHLKVVLTDGGRVIAARQLPCKLWLGPDELRSALAALGLAPGAMRHAITMTGELVDFFDSRRAGVLAILDVVTAYLDGAIARVLAGDRLVTMPEARRDWQAVASANWRAGALLVATRLPEALVVDIGSTTTDITAVRGGCVLTPFGDDHARLASDSLVYTGVTRTPLMALAPEVPVAGKQVRTMAEYFATTADVHRLSGRLSPEFDQGGTADGRGTARADNVRRIARMVGCDGDSHPDSVWDGLAQWYARRQVDLVAVACARQAARYGLTADAPVVGFGVGAFVVKDVADGLGRPYVDFAAVAGANRELAAGVAVCGPAYAVCRLAAEQCAWD